MAKQFIQKKAVIRGDPRSTKSDEFSFSHFLKRGTLLGAALGMLAGLIYLSLVGVESSETASIILWRNVILIGAVAGLVLGGAVGWWFPDMFQTHSDENHHDKSCIDKHKP